MVEKSNTERIQDGLHAELGRWVAAYRSACNAAGRDPHTVGLRLDAGYVDELLATLESMAQLLCTMEGVVEDGSDTSDLTESILRLFVLVQRERTVTVRKDHSYAMQRARERHTDVTD